MECYVCSWASNEKRDICTKDHFNQSVLVHTCEHGCESVAIFDKNGQWSSLESYKLQLLAVFYYLTIPAIDSKHRLSRIIAIGITEIDFKLQLLVLKLFKDT